MALIMLIVLNSEKIAYVLNTKPPKKSSPKFSQNKLAKLEKWLDHDLQAKSYMLASMSDELQRRFEEAVNAADNHLHLKEFYVVQIRSERHDAVKEFMTTRLRDGASVHKHGVRMIGLIEKLEGLDVVIPSELSTEILFMSLLALFDEFVVNFNMNKLEATVEEFINIFTTYEAPIKKEKHVLLMGSSSCTK
ncbi:uncharacterized protein LOC142520227 [Primulina tabacum]|uniref:uncharacterized protein LOC142520227 n=1 Tax=Primulina tabacum TaxID=48773 RepID=UPI003F594A86